MLGARARVPESRSAIGGLSVSEDLGASEHHWQKKKASEESPIYHLDGASPLPLFRVLLSDNLSLRWWIPGRRRPCTVPSPTPLGATNVNTICGDAQVCKQSYVGPTLLTLLLAIVEYACTRSLMRSEAVAWSVDDSTGSH